VAAAVGVLLWPDPATPPRGHWTHTGLEAGTLTELSLQGTAGNRALAAGTEVRVGFPHWVYGAHVEPPAQAEGGRFGHWYLVHTLDRRVPAGGSFEVSLGEVRVPRSTGPGFHPLVWIGGRLLEGLEDATIQAGPPVRAVGAARRWTGGRSEISTTPWMRVCVPRCWPPATVTTDVPGAPRGVRSREAWQAWRSRS
jgi:hypothetical protein